METKKFNVLLWDFDSDKLIYYDVLPYLRSRYKERVKCHRKSKDTDYWKVPVTLEEFKDFIERESLVRYWARCEYEMICHCWPVRKNDHKLDVYEQIMMNIDIVAELLYTEITSGSLNI